MKPYTPHQYVVDGGWDFTAITKTAMRGISDEDIDRIAALRNEGYDITEEALAEYCQRRFEQEK